MSLISLRRLSVTITGAGDRACAGCRHQLDDEETIYCGIFRKPLRPDADGTVERLRECLAAEEKVTP